MIDTLASGTAAPLVSVTIPVISARSANWAYRLCPLNTTKTHNRSTTRVDGRFIFTPPPNLRAQPHSRVKAPDGRPGTALKVSFEIAPGLWNIRSYVRGVELGVGAQTDSFLCGCSI